VITLAALIYPCKLFGPIYKIVAEPLLGKVKLHSSTRKSMLKLKLKFLSLGPFLFVLLLVFGTPDRELGWLFTLLSVLLLFRILAENKSWKRTLVAGSWIWLWTSWIWFSWIASSAAGLWQMSPLKSFAFYFVSAPFLVTHFAAFVLLRKFLSNRLSNSLLFAFSSASLFSLLEFCLSFQNATLGMFLHQRPELLFFSRIGGIFFISFLVVFCCELGLILLRKKKSELLYAIPLLSFCILSFLFDTITEQNGSRRPVGIVSIQTKVNSTVNTDLSRNVDVGSAESFWELKRLLSEAVSKYPEAKILVFPEMSMPRYYFSELTPRAKGLKEQFEGIMVQRRLTVFIGNNGQDDQGNLVNEFLVMDASTGLLEVARFPKRRPFPFAERTPEFLNHPWIRSILPPSRNLSVSAVPAIGNSAGVNWGGVICNEVFFPDIFAQHKREGAEVVVVLASESLVSETVGAAKLRAQAVVRAIESGLPIVKSSDSGGSMFVDGRGRVLKSSAGISEEILFATVQIGNGPINIGTRFHNWFLWVCLGIILLAFLFPRRL
jgi:apolipoprotein N-acyltransferase